MGDIFDMAGQLAFEGRIGGDLVFLVIAAVLVLIGSVILLISIWLSNFLPERVVTSVTMSSLEVMISTPIRASSTAWSRSRISL